MVPGLLQALCVDEQGTIVGNLWSGLLLQV